jgi:hypothetical protein
MKVTDLPVWPHRRVSFVLDDPERGDNRLKEDAEIAMAEYLAGQKWLSENTDPFAMDEDETDPEKRELIERYSANPFVTSVGITVTVSSGPFDYRLNFGEALQLLKEGHKVYREDWGNTSHWLEIGDDGRICLMSEELRIPSYSPSHDDIFSDFWALKDN